MRSNLQRRWANPYSIDVVFRSLLRPSGIQLRDEPTWKDCREATKTPGDFRFPPRPARGLDRHFLQNVVSVLDRHASNLRCNSGRYFTDGHPRAACIRWLMTS